MVIVFMLTSFIPHRTQHYIQPLYLKFPTMAPETRHLCCITQCASILIIFLKFKLHYIVHYTVGVLAF